MNNYDNIERVMELSEKLDGFKERFTCPFNIAKDFSEFIDCLFDCMDTEDVNLIYKSSQTTVEISNKISVSDAFTLAQKERILICLNIFASYFARKSGKLWD